ncbi:MAG TPA: CopG family transcriptional regulator [Kiritimatiellia bacterium]|nr:CopG family transcriptional regulator [Kiritimatiellia bacterium]
MTTLTKRATVYLRPGLHKALRLKSVETSQSLSEIVNEAVQVALAEDAEDLAAFEERAHEPVISYEAALKELKKHGKI